MGKYSEMHIELQNVIMNLTEQAELGELSNLDALIEMRKHKKEFETGLELIKDFETSHLNEIENEMINYPNGYLGHEIKVVNGRKTYDFKNITAWIEAEENKKKIESQYRLMFEAKQKGLPYANVTEDGETLVLPEINYGKSFITIKTKYK